MSNKLLALLILIGTVGGLFLLYFYFFVGYTSQLTINSNISNYKVELYSKKIGKTFNHICQDSPCILTDISPFDYSLRVRKDGYKPVYKDINIPSRSQISISINAIKEVSLNEFVANENQLSNKDRISYLRDKKKAFKFVDFENGQYAYFSTNGDLYVYMNQKTQKIDNFTFSDADILDIKSVDKTNYIYFQVGDSRYLYNLEKGKINTLELGVDINYIKEGKNSNTLIFITSVGAYIYDVTLNSFAYFYLFKDFVYTGDDYIGIIFSDEKKKLKNFNLEKKTSNLIIRYNPISKDREVLYETSLDMEKIFYFDDIVYFEVEGKRYELENL